jgi:hypothetical protein
MHGRESVVKAPLAAHWSKVFGGLLVVVVAAALWPVVAKAGGGIEATRGKKYRLTKQHGPWMIMVASFKEPPPERHTDEGLTPEQAADELVYELRKVGIPAYTFSQEEQLDQVETVDRYGRQRSMQYMARQGQICVLAGNYTSNDQSDKSDQGGKLAHDTLWYIEHKFEPKFLTEPDPSFDRSNQTAGAPIKKLKSGGILRLTSKKGLLAGAFLTLNPLLSPEEVKRQTIDPLLVKINSGEPISLLNNPGKYTLVIASFYGKSSKAHVGVVGEDTAREFEVSDALWEAATGAWEMAMALRQGYFVIQQGTEQRPRQQPFEAWVFHDKYRSVVTVGSFDRPDDPRIAQLREVFRAKFKENADTKQPFLAAEQLTIPAAITPGVLPQKRWIFDPNPQLVEVPQFGG